MLIDVWKIGVEGMENFEETFKTRKKNMHTLLDMTEELGDYVYFSNEEDYETISPHAFPMVLKDPKYGYSKFYKYLESKDIQCKTLFACLPTQHKAFEFLGYRYMIFLLLSILVKTAFILVSISI